MRTGVLLLAVSVGGCALFTLDVDALRSGASEDGGAPPSVGDASASDAPGACRCKAPASCVQGRCSFSESWTGNDGASWPPVWKFEEPRSGQPKLPVIEGNAGYVEDPSFTRIFPDLEAAGRVDMSVSVRVSENAAGLRLYCRRQSAGARYGAEFRAQSGPLRVVRIDEGESVTVLRESDVTVAADTPHHIRIECENVTETRVEIRAKAWPVGTPEPDAFEIGLDESPAASAAGAFGMEILEFDGRDHTLDDFEVVYEPR